MILKVNCLLQIRVNIQSIVGSKRVKTMNDFVGYNAQVS